MHQEPRSDPEGDGNSNPEFSDGSLSGTLEDEEQADAQVPVKEERVETQATSRQRHALPQKNMTEQNSGEKSRVRLDVDDIKTPVETSADQPVRDARDDALSPKLQSDQAKIKDRIQELLLHYRLEADKMSDKSPAEVS